MTAFDYTSMAATATRLLTRFGTTMHLRRTTPGTYDPITDTETGATVEDLPCIGLFTNISTAYAMSNEVQGGDKLAILDASQVPQMSDKLLSGAEVWAPVKIEPVNPAGVAVAFKVQVRRG